MQRPPDFFLADAVADPRLSYMTPKRGSRVKARTATGDELLMIAVTGPVAGHDFPIVWICSAEEYERSTERGEEPEAMAWPLNAVTTLDPA